MQIKIYIGLTTKEGQTINNVKAIADIVELTPFEGYTILQAKGVYKEQLEDTIIIEIYGDELIDKSSKLIDKSFALAKKLREHFNQECVMMVVNNKAYFV